MTSCLPGLMAGALLLAACSPIEVLSPPDGASIRVPWVPLVVGASDRFAGGSAEVLLDGSPFPDPLLLMRLGEETGAHLLATLDATSLTEGEHRIRVRWTSIGGEVAETESRFEVDRPAARVRFEVDDGEGRPTAARVLVRDGAGPVLLSGPAPRASEPQGRFKSWSSVLVTDGAGVVDLDPGSYTFVAVRGLREDVDVQLVEVSGDMTVLMSVPTVVATPDDVLADLHVHTGRSRDSFIPDAVRFQSLLAAGIDVAVITDHHEANDVAAQLAQVSVADGAVRLVTGVEVKIDADGTSLGHFNSFPLLPAELPEALDSPDVALYLDTYGALSSAPITQLNHPRGIQFDTDEERNEEAHALFTLVGFDRTLPLTDPVNTWLLAPRSGTGTRALDFDALEITNRFSRSGHLAVRADWFALMNQGFFLTGTGNSDSHALEVERAGFPDNLVRVRPPAPGEPLDADAFVSAIRAGHVTVSTGPVLDLEVYAADGRAGGPGDLLVGGSGWVARLHVRAAAWVPCPALRLVVNGEVVFEALLPARHDTLLDQTVELPLALGADAWVLAEAGTPIGVMESGVSVDWPAPWAWILPEYEPLAFTNPVRVDVDGDGLFTAPGLPR
ncbi:MAG: hypothetical protein EXR71_09255 [Myxococcales bacterium]|nr:hypothetical protein [Myxococcales bacterium]